MKKFSPKPEAAKTVFISGNALESALEAAKNLFPNEFIGLFREKKGVLSELILAPFSEYGPDSSGFSDWHLPLDSSITASFHSHPGWGNAPSQQDLLFFSKTYRNHLIACRPYSPRAVACYDNLGRKTSFEIVK